MKPKMKLTTSTIALLASFSTLPFAQAQLDAKIMKEVTKYFRPDKIHFSPVIGITALESGLIHNFRFYGSLDMGSRPENRDERLYTNDKAHRFDSGTDAIFHLLHTLFRSPAGILDQHVAGTGFANFHSIVTPEKVAFLLNYVQELTKTTNDLLNSSKGDKKAQNKEIQFDKIKGLIIKKHQELKNTYKEFFLSNISEEQKKEGTKGLEKDVKDLLKFIADAVLQEQQPDSERKFLYPTHTTEQIILAYFCHKFNTQRDVVEFLCSLNDQIINPARKRELDERWQHLQESHGISDDLLSVEDLDKIITKPTYTIDDIYALTHGRIFDLQSTPYHDPKLISNGHCHAYDRQYNNEVNITYADCAETSARHFMNLMLYDPSNNTFDLSYLEKHMAAHPNPYFEKFLEFYRYQTLDMVNDGSLRTRSKWNEVVGDLNKKESNNESNFPNVKYVQNIKTNEITTEYELSSGIINLLNMFGKIFSISFKALESKSSINQKKQWIEDSLAKLIETINPSLKLELDSSHLQEDNVNKDEIEGTINFVVQSTDDENLFSFDYYGKPGIHSAIRELKQLKILPQKANHEDRISQFKQDLDNKIDAEKLQGVEENLWLASKDRNLIERFIKHPLYKILDHKLHDNDSIIDFFKNFLTYHQTAKQALSDLQNQQLKKITSNLLESFSWQDDAVFDEISPILKDILAIKGIHEVFSSSDIQRPLEKISFEDLFGTYRDTKLRYVSIEDDNKEIINLSTSSLNCLKSVKELTIKSKKIEKIEFTEDMLEITFLEIPNSRIREISGIHHLPNLKNLILNGTTNLKKLEFTQDMPQLSFLSLDRSSIEEIKGIHHLLNLERLCLANTQNLKKMEFIEDTLSLNSLSLYNSAVEEIRDIHHLPNLKNLILNSTTNLKKLKFTQDMPQLSFLSLDRSSIEEIKGFHHLISLKNLSLKGLDNIKKLEFTQDMPQLLSICLGESKIEEFILGEKMTKLKRIDFSNNTNLKSLKLNKNYKDLEINLRNSGITQKSQIEGFEFLDETKIKW